MALLSGGITDLVDPITGMPNDGGAAGLPFPTFIRPAQNDAGEAAFGGTCQPDQYSPILRFTVPAGVRYAWGSGTAEHEANQGYIYVYLKDSAGNEIPGTVRIAQSSQTGRNTVVVQDLPEEQLHGDPANRTQKQPLPEQVEFPYVKQDSHMVVEFKPEAETAVTIDNGQSTFKVPATEYDLTAV